jgi:capsular polysaccharide biosynthesis protein/tetratricopeptide (TPR) repeat protein
MTDRTNPADPRLQAAREAGLRRQHQRAIDLCVAVLQERPGDPMAVAFLALSLWRAQAFAQAIDVLQQALRHFPAQEELNLTLLDCWRASGKMDDALRFAATLPGGLLDRPLFKSWKAALAHGVSALGPGLVIEDRLDRLYAQGKLAEAEEELAPQLLEHPRWGKGHVLQALLTFAGSGRGIPPAALAFPENADDAAQIESTWRESLKRAMSAYRGRVLAQVRTALELSPQDASARLLLARTRCEEQLPIEMEEVEFAAAALGSRLLGPFELRAVHDPRLSGVVEAKLLQPAAVVTISEPRSVGAQLDLTGAIGPALTCTRYVASAVDARVAAGSDVVLLSDGSALCDPLSHALGECVNYVEDGWIGLGGTGQVLLRDLPVTHVRGAAISLLGASARFYGHWLLDHLQRLRSLEQLPQPSAATVLVEDGMPASHYEALELLLGPQATMQRIAAGHCVRADRLLFAGPDVFFPHRVRRNLPTMPSIAPSSVDGMTYLRERVLAALGRPARRGGRIVVRRRSATRHVSNEDELCDILVRHWGFQELYPETLSFADQVTRFHDADIVVGAQGSALSNCVFCAPGARVFALCSRFAANFPSWAQALEALGMRHCFVVGEADSTSHFLPIQCDFRIEPGVLVQALADCGVAPQ